MLESTYQWCLKHELELAELRIKSEVELPIIYKGTTLDKAYRMDIIVEDTVVVELKALEFINDVHEAQLLSYLKLGKYPLGLLINFNVKLLKDGIVRRKNGYSPL